MDIITSARPQGPACADSSRYPYEDAAARSLPVCSPATFASLLPKKPYCADEVRDGLRILPAKLAITKRHIQVNSPNAFRFILHDIDYPGSYYAARDGILPPPNIIMVHKQKKHAHCAYMLETPVARHSAARLAPLRFFAAVENGFRRRLMADPNFTGLIIKNPLHSDWHVEWLRENPYTLTELHGWLFPRDLEGNSQLERWSGASRNVACFDVLRLYAYKNVLQLKKAGENLSGFESRLFELAMTTNYDFSVPLTFGELRSISRSVAKWVWRVFSDSAFSALQSVRGRRGAACRWADHSSVEAAQPWVPQGISRATYYRKLQGRRAL
jgi:hypothetical protein